MTEERMIRPLALTKTMDWLVNPAMLPHVNWPAKRNWRLGNQLILLSVPNKLYKTDNSHSSQWSQNKLNTACLSMNLFGSYWSIRHQYCTAIQHSFSVHIGPDPQDIKSAYFSTSQRIWTTLDGSYMIRSMCLVCFQTSLEVNSQRLIFLKTFTESCHITLLTWLKLATLQFYKFPKNVIGHGYGVYYSGHLFVVYQLGLNQPKVGDGCCSSQTSTT